MLVSWSGGKDSALAFDRLRRDAAWRVVGLLTTVTSGYDRISIHGVRRELLHAQARGLDVPVHEIVIPPQSSNETYERAWADAMRSLPSTMSARTIAFGDIFLEDVRAYRESMATTLGFRPVFPIWGEPSRELALEVINAGFAARIVCVDTQSLAADFVGRSYDRAFIDSLPDGIDPCGERGEFHTFVSDGPGFRTPVQYTVGEVVLREERFAYCDLVPA